MKLKTLFAASLLSCVATSVSAHDRWLLPSHSNVSNDKGEWIMLDVSASNEVFSADKPLGAERLEIIAPNEKRVFPSSSYRGHRKSVVDIHLETSGTYRLEMRGEGDYWTRFKLDGENDWMRGNKLEVKDKLPKGATDVESMVSYSNIQTYVTLNNPTDNFAMTGKGLELMPITHPSDVAQGELAEFKLMFNGKPQAGVKAEVVREGARYRNDPEVKQLVSNKDGIIQFTPTHAGRYLLMANHSETLSNDPLADKVGGQLFFTFEAILD